MLSLRSRLRGISSAGPTNQQRWFSWERWSRDHLSRSLWQPTYEDDIARAPPRTNLQPHADRLAEIRDGLEVEQRHRFDAIINRQQRSLIENGHRRLFEQTLPIGQPDPVPRRQYRKKETHGKVKALAMTGNELAAREQTVRERAET